MIIWTKTKPITNKYLFHISKEKNNISDFLMRNNDSCLCSSSRSWNLFDSSIKSSKDL